MSLILMALNPKRLAPEQAAKLNLLAGDHEVIFASHRDEMEPLLERVEIAAGEFPVDCLQRAPHLKWYQQWGAGADWLMLHPELVEKDFILTNASGVHAIPISEHILSFLLAFARRLPESIRAQDRCEWLQDTGKTVFEVSGKTLLLIGVGAIGSRTARVASEMGMRVWGVRRNPGEHLPGVDRMFGPEHWLEALPEADFIVLTVPETRETRRMINAGSIARMKPGAYLINIGRGGTVDQDALVQALRENRLAGAGLDVFDSEPLPPDSPLWSLPNVILTAHYSGSTPQYHQRAMDIFLDNLERFLHQQPLKNVVDKKLGY